MRLCMASALSSAILYLLYLAAVWHVVLDYFTEPLPMAVIACLRQQ